MIAAPTGFRGGFRADHRARAAYSECAGPYRIVPAAVATPDDNEDLVLLVRHASAEGWTLVPRGAGSGMPGGSVGRGVIVDLRRFDQPLTVHEPDRATVGAAVTWKSLDETAARHGLRFPPNPSSGASCTFGGMVATNAAGARSVLSGQVRPWIQGLDIVTGNGEIVTLTRGEDPDKRRSNGATRALARTRRDTLWTRISSREISLTW